MILLQLIAESRWKAVGSWAFAYPKPDLASSTVCSDCQSIAGDGDPQDHARHVIVVVLDDEFVCRGIGDGHLGRDMRNKVAVKKPMAGRWNPVRGHGSVGEQPVGGNGALLFGRENVIGFAITRAVHAK